MSVAQVRSRLAAYRQSLGPEDTFVMYSHSHGVSGGLLLDAEVYPWAALAADLVALPARNVVIFTMSCHSGALTEALEASASTWQGERIAAGRNLVVLTAVSKDQLSQPTNNSTAEDAIGNPFTYAVRSALGGAADGAHGGAKDQQLSLEELVRYVLETTKQVSPKQSAEPQLAGEYDKAAVLAAVPGQVRGAH